MPDPEVRDLLLAKVDELTASMATEQVEVREVTEQLEPERARSCRNAITMCSVMVDDIRVRAHAWPPAHSLTPVVGYPKRREIVDQSDETVVAVRRFRVPRPPDTIRTNVRRPAEVPATPARDRVETAAKAVHWRESLRYEISRAIAAGCTLEHLAAVTGFDHETIERLRREPQRDFNGRHPTDPHAPGQEQFYR